jgi:hypothetical protein
MPKSKSDVHLTPEIIFLKIERVWGYKRKEMFDPCPINPKKDGLKIKWKKVNYVNPPYGNGKIKGTGMTLIGMFVEKAIAESYRGNRTIMLLPSKTDQDWFHDLIRHGYEIRYWRGRIKFANNKDSATQPHFLVMIK